MSMSSTNGHKVQMYKKREYKSKAVLLGKGVNIFLQKHARFCMLRCYGISSGFMRKSAPQSSLMGADQA